MFHELAYFHILHQLLRTLYYLQCWEQSIMEQEVLL